MPLHSPTLIIFRECFPFVFLRKKFTITRILSYLFLKFVLAFYIICRFFEGSKLKGFWSFLRKENRNTWDMLVCSLLSSENVSEMFIASISVIKRKKCVLPNPC